MGPPPPEPADETTLDMNPLIDVALVLLIFFILTATVATLRRTIALPPPQSPESGAPKQEQLQDRTFTVTVTLDERQQPVVKVSTSGGAERVIAYEDIVKELTEVVKATGRKEMILKMSNDVVWDVFVQINSAATQAGVTNLHMPEAK
jgi:biopolymer transport protein ExbD